MTEATKEKRDILKKLSHAAKQMAEDDDLTQEEFTVNQLIMKYVHNPENEFTFNTFHGWKNEGYTIKKGSKAFFIWGQPVASNKKKEDQNTEEDEENSFFPLAYLFRNDQVLKPIRKTANTTPTPTRTETAEPIEDLPF